MVALYCAARRKSPRSKANDARVIPHPGQGTPKKYAIGQTVPTKKLQLTKKIATITNTIPFFRMSSPILCNIISTSSQTSILFLKMSSSDCAHRSIWQASDSLSLYALVYAVSRRISFLFSSKKTLRELLKGSPTRPFSYSVLLSHNRSNWKMGVACSGKAASQ